MRLYGLQPQGAIDLFAGQDLVVLARYAGTREDATLVIDGRTSEGPVRWTGHVSFPAHTSQNAFVARLWAVQRVGYLSAERRLRGGNAEIDAELRQLGERYGIPTELTSYLVTENGALPVPGAPAGIRKQGMSTVGANVRNAPSAMQFEAAKTASELRAVTSLGDFNNDARRDTSVSTRQAGNRSFTLRDSVWTRVALR